MRPFHVLFLCTGNSARSIMAERLLARHGEGRFRAFSAGSHPRGQVNPLALELLREFRLPAEGLRSKSWDEFTVPGAPPVDLVITVCDDAAAESCPAWPGAPAMAHWSIADPAEAGGTPADRRRTFREAFHELDERIRALVMLPVATLDHASLQAAVRDIGSRA